jgi:ATP-dependent protease ClpP protease subunit
MSKFKKKPEQVEPPAAPVQVASQQQEPPGAVLRRNGTVMLCGNINRASIEPIVTDILEYNYLPKDEQPDNITLIINSQGGYIDYAKMLIDVIRASNIPVCTVGLGIIASCGLMVHMVGDQRNLSSTCSILSHQFSGGGSGKEHDLVSHFKYVKQVGKWVEDHYVACTGLTRKSVRKNLLPPSDVWLTPKQAIKFNLADTIIDFNSNG